jgi:hypothetical protein
VWCVVAQHVCPCVRSLQRTHIIRAQRKHASTQAGKHASTRTAQARKHASTQARKQASTQARAQRKHASTPRLLESSLLPVHYLEVAREALHPVPPLLHGALVEGVELRAPNVGHGRGSVGG